MSSAPELLFSPRQACDGRGNYNKQLAAEIEEGYRIFSEEADIAGKLHLKDIERLCREQKTENGEYILVKTRSKKKGRYVPLAFQMFEADWLTS